MYIPEDIVVGQQRYLLVGAKKGPTKKTVKFPTMKKTKPKSKTQTQMKAPSKKDVEEQKKKQLRLQELAALIKKPKLTGEEKEELEDLEKMYPNEAKQLRAALPKGTKQVVELTDDEKGQDFADSLTDDEDDDDESEDESDDEVEKEEKKPTKTQTAPKSEPKFKEPSDDWKEKARKNDKYVKLLKFTEDLPNEALDNQLKTFESALGENPDPKKQKELHLLRLVYQDAKDKRKTDPKSQTLPGIDEKPSEEEKEEEEKETEAKPTKSEKSKKQKTKTRGGRKSEKKTEKKPEEEELKPTREKKTNLQTLLESAEENEDEDEFPRRGKGKGRRDDDDEDEVRSGLDVEELKPNEAKDQAAKKFDWLTSDDDDLSADEKAEKDKYSDYLVKHVEIGLSPEQQTDRAHLTAKKNSVGLNPNEERKLSKLNDASSLVTQHYDDLGRREKEAIKNRFIEDHSNKLLADNKEQVRDKNLFHSFARRIAVGEELKPGEKTKLHEMIRKEPEAAKRIFNSRGVDLSIPDNPEHPPAWKHITHKNSLGVDDAKQAIKLYHKHHELSSQGDFDSQQELKKLQSVLDNPQNLDKDARAEIDKAGIKTKWNQEPSGEKNFKRDHIGIIRQIQKDEADAKQDKDRKVREKKERDHDSNLDKKSILSRDKNDLVMQYHRLLHRSKSSTKAKHDLAKLQKVLNHEDLPKDVQERLEKEGIPTKANPNPGNEDIHKIRQFQRQKMDEASIQARKKKKDVATEVKERTQPEPEESQKSEEKTPEEKKPEEKNPRQTQTMGKPPELPKSVEEFHKRFNKCPPGYRRDQEDKKCVVREDAKKNEIWQPPKGVGQQSQKQDVGTARTMVANRGANVAKAINNFDNLSKPTQEKVLDFAAKNVSDLADHVHQVQKNPEQKKGLLSVLRRIGDAIKPRLSSLFKIHKVKANAVANSLDKAHHVAVLGKDPKDWGQRQMDEKSASEVIDNLSKAK